LNSSPTCNLLFGIYDPTEGDVDGLAMKQNLLLGASLRFKIFDPLTFGIEYTYFDGLQEPSRRAGTHGLDIADFRLLKAAAAIGATTRSGGASRGDHFRKSGIMLRCGNSGRMARVKLAEFCTDVRLMDPT
jgi:hypothetical protein